MFVDLMTCVILPHIVQTVSALGTFFLAMVLFPDIQQKARAQIDAVCQGRLPDIMDQNALPYVTALMKESVRWHNVVPLSQ